ncbi:MAG: NMT1-like family, partial [Pseudomonadota bacterium]
PVYGALDADHRDALRPRVPVAQTLENLRAMQALGAAHGFRVVWLNMPINRTHPELVERYVNYDDRAQIFAASAAGAAPPVIDIDDRWARSREAGLHILGHVFHPNARGHRRLAEQVAAELTLRDLLPGLPPTAATPPVGGPPPAPTEDTLRLGISSLTPVHAHVLAVLQADPGLAARHGLRVELRSYVRGGPQGEDVAAGRLDAWFSCELPAIEMARSRPDAGLVATPGALGRIAALGQTGEPPTAGARVGLSPGSTPALDWARWGRGSGAVVVSTQTEALLDGVQRRELDLMVSWDPWVSAAEAEGLQAAFSRPFHSVLMVGGHWARGGRSALRPQGEEGPPRAARLVALVEEALRTAAADRPRWDAEVAALSGWPVEIVRAVADQNDMLAGRAVALGALAPTREGLAAARAHLGLGPTVGAEAPELLEGRPPAWLESLGGAPRPSGAGGPGGTGAGGGKGPPGGTGAGGGKGPPGGGRPPDGPGPAAASGTAG